MRFTVHDSPDYYQLKVSIFNDDRKTEIIGETRVSLEDIIVPGGGQNDLWHQLNCKGRFAGEIRIELTYYDTRPKEAKVEERRQSSTVGGLETTQREGSVGLSGPRQPKPVKRRPLPADPTMSDPSQSSPQPYTTPPNNQYQPPTQQLSPAPSPSARMDPSTPMDSQYMQTASRGSKPDLYGYGGSFPRNDPINGHVPEHQSPIHDEYLGGADHDEYGYIDTARQDYGSHVDQPIQRPVSYNNDQCYGSDYRQATSVQREGPYAPEYAHPAEYDDRNSPYSPQPRRGTYSISPTKPSPLPQHVSMPDVRPQQGSPSSEHSYHRSSLPASDSYDQRSPRYQAPDERSIASADSPGAVNENAPPPPPAHRSSLPQISPHSSGRGHPESYSPLAGPPPLNIRNARNSISASPLSQVQTNDHRDAYQPPISPFTARTYSQPNPSRLPHDYHGHPSRRRSPEHFPTSPIREYGQMTPPILIPGYDPRVADDESEHLMRENEPNQRQISEPVPQYQAFATHNTISRAHPSPRHDTSSQPGLVNDTQDRRPHRASAPVIPRREVSPDPRTPIRKSVSPQPEQANGERRLSAVPFGPDSYDAFNPSLNKASSINSSGPKYNTPEQAKEAHFEQEREAKLAEGPIIGSDGRVIDPSDHLPTETWAPEPESKAPKKKPEVTVRFRRSPAGAQPMPLSTRRTATEVPQRPSPMVTPAYAHSSDTISPTSGARSRLQKKSRVAIVHPVSSPAVPTISTNARPVASRPNQSDYPVREYENYDYGSSPTYARKSLGSVPPPIPGKVPLSAGTGQEDWGMSALSEEMRRIDIGVGAGQGRSRRNRYGA